MSNSSLYSQYPVQYLAWEQVITTYFLNKHVTVNKTEGKNSILLIYFKDRGTERSSICSSPKCPQELELGQIKVIQVAYAGGRDPGTWAITCCFPDTLARR